MQINPSCLPNLDGRPLAPDCENDIKLRNVVVDFYIETVLSSREPAAPRHLRRAGGERSRLCSFSTPYARGASAAMPGSSCERAGLAGGYERAPFAFSQRIAACLPRPPFVRGRRGVLTPSASQVLLSQRCHTLTANMRLHPAAYGGRVANLAPCASSQLHSGSCASGLGRRARIELRTSGPIRWLSARLFVQRMCCLSPAGHPGCRWEAGNAGATY